VTTTEGFKSGGFAAGVFSDDNLTFRPETAQAYEAGFKSKWLGGSFILNGKNLTGEEESVLILDQPVLPGNYVSAALPSAPSFHLNFRYQTD
jgi:hypothetical protein